MPVARPVVATIVATSGPPERSGELQVEAFVLSKVDPSLNVSVAVYCWITVAGIEAAAGVTSNFVDVAAFTVNVTVAVLPSKVAVMMVDVLTTLPVAMPVFNPTEALAGVPEIQLEDVVTSRVDPSLYVAVAVNCWVPVAGTEAVAGVTSMDTKLWGGNQCPVSAPSPPPPPHPVIKKPLRMKINNR